MQPVEMLVIINGLVWVLNLYAPHSHCDMPQGSPNKVRASWSKDAVDATVNSPASMSEAQVLSLAKRGPINSLLIDINHAY